jgi:UDP-N-acetylmuramyl pentapeptide phosphotransferase/UDP-N-acetylglucosamine-1-phosphate transferase
LSPDWQASIGLGATLVVTPLLAWVSLKTGWLTDSKVAGQEWRKPRSQAVALVGGGAVLIGLLLSGYELPWAALLAAFLVGTWDDLRPLPAGSKLIGQTIAGALLAFELGSGTWEFPLVVFAAVVAQNAMNTWDHADGLCAGLMGAALPPVLAGPFLGFLPWNLLLMRKERGDPGSGVPWAYLGDAGSHLCGILMVWYEPARPFLILPLLDLARVVWLRMRAGEPFWVGDRRHLGHRLLDVGHVPKLAALLALAPCLPLLAVDRLGIKLASLACLGLLAALLWNAPPETRPPAESGLDEI